MPLNIPPFMWLSYSSQALLCSSNVWGVPPLFRGRFAAAAVVRNLTALWYLENWMWRKNHEMSRRAKKITTRTSVWGMLRI